MLTEFSSLYALDTNRIWAAGKSDGGGFCNVLACNSTLSTQIAAFAPVSGAFYVPGPTGNTCDPDSVPISCSPGRAKIPIIEFHAFHDNTIDYDGSSTRDNSCLPTIPHWTQQWALRDGLSATNVSSNLTSDTLKYTFGTGEETGLVTQYTDFNASFHHDWPSTVLDVVLEGGDKDVASFNATPIIMKFFQDNPLA
jgi:poly(3-hydroxybutyrate) depolymerase